VLDERLTLPMRLEKLAYDKGVSVASRYPGAIVISADTMVCLEEQMLGKASTREKAKALLQQQSGKKQTVYTAIAIFEDGVVTTYCDTSDVWFKVLSNNDIEEYLDTNEWQGKAGAYAIQGIGSRLVDDIIGDKETIIGLPVRLIEAYLDRK
jgi:septum formation protein